MKTKLFTLLLVLSFTGFTNAQQLNTTVRFIEVTGSAEMEVEPDEIQFQIGIEEYWKEEFEKRKKYEDYVTIIPLKIIETNLMNALTKIGIKKEQVIIKEVGDSWNRSGKNFKKSKTIELVLTDFSVISELLENVNVRGVNSMKIAVLKNKDITKYRKQVKIEAMIAAKKKAAYLLESVDEKLGKVISVIELNDNSLYSWMPKNTGVNTYIPSNENNGNNIRKIKLSYKIQMKFKIK